MDVSLAGRLSSTHPFAVNRRRTLHRSGSEPRCPIPSTSDDTDDRAHLRSAGRFCRAWMSNHRRSGEVRMGPRVSRSDHSILEVRGLSETGRAEAIPCRARHRWRTVRSVARSHQASGRHRDSRQLHRHVLRRVPWPFGRRGPRSASRPARRPRTTRRPRRGQRRRQRSASGSFGHQTCWEPRVC